MKALLLTEPGALQIAEIEAPAITPGLALVRMEFCGVCGSDLTAFTGKNPTVRYPIRGVGHEGVGVVEAIEANDRGVAVGDRVALEPYIPCLNCHSCAQERYNNCVDIRVAGVHTGGMMAERIAFPIRLLHKLPAGMDDLDAALIEPLTIGLHAASRARVQKGEYVAITGAGPIGLLAAFGVKSLGATPILIDVLEERLAFARSCGVEHTWNSAQGDPFAYLNEVCGGLPQALIECTGAPAILESMHDYVWHGGRIALVGWPKGPVTVNTVRCIQKELDICPSRNSNKQFPASIALLASGAIPSARIVTKRVRLDKTHETIVDMIANPRAYMKVLVDIAESKGE